MKKQGFNPYLPSWEYIPDGEPHVINGRVYVYGSHDRFNGHVYCPNDYVCWSAPVDDLGNWRYEGVIYKKEDDPLNVDGRLRNACGQVSFLGIRALRGRNATRGKTGG